MKQKKVCMCVFVEGQIW